MKISILRDKFLGSPIQKYCSFLAFFFLLFMVRYPEALIYGRFWAEEGTIFFQNAATLPFWKALVFSYGGYLNLPANVAGLLAYYCFPLRFAPYFTSFYGVIFQLFPVMIIFSAKETWLDNWQKKLFVAFLVTMVPASAEISFQSLHGQIWLDLCCALIICMHPLSGRGEYFRYFCLALAPLSGLGALLFVPFLGLRAFLEKRKERVIEFCLISFFGCVQFCLFHMDFPDRDHAHSVGLILATLFVRGPVELACSGLHLVAHFYRDLGQEYLLSIYSFGFLSLLSGFFFLFIVALALYKKSMAPLWAIAIIFIFTSVSILNSLKTLDGEFFFFGVHGRYLFLEQALICLAFFILALEYKNYIGFSFKILLFFFTLNSLICCVEMAFSPVFAHGSNWGDEIQKHQQDSCYPMRIWPGSKNINEPAWHLYLPQGKNCLTPPPPRDKGTVG